MAEDKWSNSGITFKILTLDNYEQVKLFLDSYFFPEEPIFRGTNFFEGNGYFDNKMYDLIYEMFIKDCLKDATSMVAIDKNGDIIGSR